MYEKQKNGNKNENILTFDIHRKTYGIDLRQFWLYNKMVKSKKFRGGGVYV